MAQVKPGALRQKGDDGRQIMASIPRKRHGRILYNVKSALPTMNKLHIDLKRPLALLLAILMCVSVLPAVAPAAKADAVEISYLNSTFTENSDGTVTIKQFDTEAGITEISIPKEVTVNAGGDKKVVSAIGESAFASANLTSVAIAEDSEIKSIGASAFVSNPFTDFPFPASLETMGERAFESSGLETIDLSKTKLEIIPQIAFQFVQAKAIKFPTAGTLKRIENNAFYDNKINTTVVFPAGIEYIGFSAFYRTTKTNVGCLDFSAYAPGSIETGGTSCHNISQVWGDPDGKNAASNSPFIFNYETGVIVGLKEDCATRDYDGWDHTTGTLTIPKQIDGVEVTAIYGGAFNRYPSYDNLKAITFEDGITAIESFPPYSFAAPNAKEINNIPASVKTLEIRSMCLNLAIEELSFPGVTNVGSMVFEGCNNLKKITFGSTSISGRAIASDAFRNINGNKLKDIYFSVPKDTVNGAPWLCYYADIHWSDDVTPRMVRTGTDKYGHKWEYASSAKSILMYAGTLDELRDEETGRSDLILPSEITDDETGETYIIENVGFGSTRVFDFVDPEKTEVHLTSISADEGVKTIERGAFNDTAIDVIDFSNSTIQSILVQAFQRSKSTTILLPDSLLVLGDSAFAGKNQQFTEITIPGNVKTLHAKAFLNVENLTVNIMMKRYARSDDPGFTQGEWRTGDTVYIKAPSTIVNNAPFSAKSPKIYYVDSPRPEPEFEVTANPTNNTAEIVVNGYTSYIFFIIKGEGEEPSGIEYLGTDDGSSETATGNITKSNPEAQGTENPAVSNPVIVTSNGTYKFAFTMTRSATQDSPDAEYERFEGSLYNAVVDAFHTVTYAKDEHVSAGASPVDAASYVEDYLVTAASAEGLSLDGYVFQGWTYTDAKGRDILVKPGQTFKMPNENVTLTETWIKASEVDANVNFHAGEGATFGNGPDLTLGAKIGAPIADVLKNYAPEKPGYKLLGWSTDSEATAPNTYVVPSVESVGTETPEVHLYAVWEIRNDIVVTFDGNGGKIGESYTLTSAPGTFGADLTVPEATRDGYTFVEWNTQADGRGETLVAKYPADNAIYYAIWKADTHKVTFSAGANGTFKDASAVTELEGIPTDTQLMAAESWDGFKVPEIQANEGYVFSGWQAPDGVLYASKEVETYTMGATDAEFVAQYVEIGKSTINFDYVGGSDDAGATNKVVTGFVGADLAEADRPTGLTKTGYQFNGWTVDGEDTDVATLKFPAQGGVITVVASWTPISYKVVFHNGDTTKIQSGFTYDREKTLTKLSALGFTEEGSEFRGWATEENGNPVYTDGQKVKNLTATDKATVDLYAVWEFTDVTVTFIANDSVYATKTGKAGQTIEKPEDPTKEGYEFDGWYDGETKLSFEGDEAAKFPERNATYIAKFNAVAQNLKFVVDAAKGEVTGTLEFTVLTGEKLSTAEGFAVPNVTAKEGFTFNGWMAEDGTLYNETNLPNVTMIAGGMTFTAQFTEQNKGTIIFNFNGGKVGEETMAQFSGTPNTAFAETAPAPEMTGYTLTGWSEDIAALTYPAEGETKTVTAQWTANTYKVVFHDGDATKEQTGFTYDEEKALDANTFEKAGSTFKGWAISPDGAVAYLDGATVKNLTAEADGSFDLYAVWEADQVTVTFIANGAEFAQKTGNVGELIEDPGTPDAPAGYEFDGWYDGATKLDFATAVYPDAPKTYTAKFNATKQKVTFTVGEGGHLVNASAQVEFEVETDAKLTDVTAPEVVAEDGYTFVGWVKDGVTYTAESLKNLTMGSEDITFNAQFTSKTASTIIFNANGGAFEDGASIKIETGTAGTAFNGTVPTPTREGYNFTGWLPEIGTAITFPAEGETLIYTAQWTAIEYTVKYVVETPDGAPEGTTVSAAPAEANYTEGTAVTLAAAPEINNGYVFAGWTASGALTGTYEAGAEITMPVGNVTFTATFTAPAKVIIGFNLGADDAVMTNPALAAQELKVGEKATVPEVSRPGYKLAGWVSSDISFANLDADATETPAAVTGKNVVYTAQWTAVESDVKFEAGEHGTLEGGTEFQVATGEKLENVTAPEVKPEAGYTFLGWKSSLGGLYQADEIADIVMVAEGITFTAQYAQNKNTAIYYDFNGGIADGKTSAFWTGVAGTEFTEELPVPEKTGYTLTAPEKPASFPDDGVTVIKAEWTAVEYNVTYVVAVPEGAPEGTTVSEAPAASTTASDSTVTLAAAPTASNGYEFVGWVASGALSGTYEAGATVTMPAGDVTFTAQFAAPAKVLFAFNLGAEDASAEGATEAEVRVGETAQLPTNLQRPGYEFDGWKSSNEAYADLAKDAAATPAAVKGENVVYTAQWTPIDNTVTFVADANSKLEGETSFTVKTGAKLEGAVIPREALRHADLRAAAVGIAGVLHPCAVDLLRRDHLPDVPGLAEEDVPALVLVVHREVKVAEVEIGVVGVGAGEVELKLAVELPALVGLGRVEVQTEDRVVHAEHRLVVAVPHAVAARQHPVGVDVGLGLVRVVHGLEGEVAVRRDPEARLGKRLEDAGGNVGQVELRTVAERPDATSLVGRGVLARHNLRSRPGIGGGGDRRRLGGAKAPLQLGDALGLRLDLGVLLLDERAEGLQVGLRHRVRRRCFDGGHKADAKHGCKQYLFHICSFLAENSTTIRSFRQLARAAPVCDIIGAWN